MPVQKSLESYWRHHVILFKINHLLADNKGFQVWLFNTNNYIQHYSFVCTQLNGFKYCSLILLVLFNIIHSIAHSLMVSSMENDKIILFDP